MGNNVESRCVSSISEIITKSVTFYVAGLKCLVTDDHWHLFEFLATDKQDPRLTGEITPIPIAHNSKIREKKTTKEVNKDLGQ